MCDSQKAIVRFARPRRYGRLSRQQFGRFDFGKTMCGFVGELRLNGSPTHDRERFFEANDLLEHRGPDDEGYVFDGPLALGHKRLSIIDLSEAGHQPMADASNRYWIVYNGEIYNHTELRSELIQRGVAFKSACDTEVLLYSFIAFGVDCLNKLDGMFSFAIWDRHKRQLFLARDPFGIKPLYYMIDSNTFYFASEIKALIYLSRVRADIDVRSLSDYLTFQYVLDDRTLFKNVHKLGAGCHITVPADGAAVKSSVYWHPTFEKSNLPEETAVEMCRNILDSSVNKQLRSDVPIGAHLSGGLDTAALVAFASRRLDHRMATFTAGFRDSDDIFDDTSMARITASFNGTDHFEVFPDASDFEKHFDAICWFMDEPAAAPGIFPQYIVSKLASKHVKVVLGGQGADELAGGYARYLIAYLDAAQRAGTDAKVSSSDMSLAELRPGVSQLRSYGPLMSRLSENNTGGSDAERYAQLILRQADATRLLTVDAQRTLDGYDPIARFRELFEEPGNEVSLLDRILNYEVRAWLPALLHVEDRMSMAWSIESRVPFLTRDLADFLFSLDTKTRFKAGRLKHLIRGAVQGLVPPEVVAREDKIGFPVPINHWFTGSLRDWLHDRLNVGRVAQRGYFLPETIDAIFAHEGNLDRRTWGILNVETWFRLMVDGEGSRGRSTKNRQRKVHDLNSNSDTSSMLI